MGHRIYAFEEQNVIFMLYVPLYKMNSAFYPYKNKIFSQKIILRNVKRRRVILIKIIFFLIRYPTQDQMHGHKTISRYSPFN
jgi:hypothetical protein